MPLRALRSLSRYEGAFAVALGGEAALRSDSIIWADAIPALRAGVHALTMHQELRKAAVATAPTLAA